MADYVPALQAHMGDWKYYVTVMKIGKIARECMLAEEIHPNKDLDDLIQREIHERVGKEMVPYLLTESQRFYGALVVAVYGGDPEFSPVRVHEHELLDDKDKSSYGFGLLRFDGSQIYYALDGQHRLKSMQEAIKIKPNLAKEEITVIILNHEGSEEGLRRTRRLFSTLNRTAKPTSSGLNIAIDEDDAVAIITRRLVKESTILQSLISSNLASKQINPGKKNDPYITTITVLYEVNEILLGAYNEGMQIDNKFKQFRPSDDNLDKYYLFLENIWKEMLDCCPDFDHVKSGIKKPGELRLLTGSDSQPILDDGQKPIPGGNVFMRPIGQYVIAEVVKQAGIQRKSIPEVIQAIMTHVSMDIDNAPWVGLIWDSSKKTIMGTKKEQAIIVAIICHALGLRKPLNAKSKKSLKVRDLKQEYRDAIGDPKASLLQPIVWSGRTIQSQEEDDDEDHT